MKSSDCINMKLANCYITIDGKRYIAANAKSLEAKVEVTNAEVPMLGRMMKGHKTTGLAGSGTVVMYWITDILSKIVERCKNFGYEPLFEIQETNDDPTSTVGIHTTILKDCRIDGELLIAAFDGDSDEVLEQEVEFTFDDFEMPDKFNDIAGNASVSGILNIASNIVGRSGL